METIGHSRIAGIGAYLPERIVTSEELMAEVNCRRFGIPDDYLSRHVGILERRWAEPDMQPSDLATLASKVALRNSGVTADEIDLILFTGITKDCEEPSTAHFVQNKINSVNAVCLDVSNACLGFMTGIVLADSMISSGSARRVLVCTGEAPSKMMFEVISILRSAKDREEFKAKLGFLTAGDGGAAMVLEASNSDAQGFKWMRFQSNGKHAGLCHYTRSDNGLVGAMLMKEISREIVSMHSEAIEKTYQSLQWTSTDVDKVYSHQVGRKPHYLLAKIAGVPIEKAPITYDLYGNLTSATIPVDMFLNPPERNERVLIMGTGSGLTVCQGGVIY